MPKLPEQKARDFELLDKNDFKRGALSGSKPVIIKHHLRLPIKPIIGMVVVIVLLGGIYIVTKTYFPNLFKQKAPQQAQIKPFEYPLNVTDISYPSDFLKQKFLENFQKAASEKDENIRYKYLEENFTFLLGYYNYTHSYDSRVQLQKFSDYMKKNYPKQAEANKTLYDFSCVDKLCPGASEAKYPLEIIEIQKALQENSSISPAIRDSIIRNLDTAVLLKDKNNQGNAYVSVLTSLSLEYKTSKDQSVKDLYLKLNDYVGKNYPEFKVPQSVRIEN